jgi:hypothetical protein
MRSLVRVSLVLTLALGLAACRRERRDDRRPGPEEESSGRTEYTPPPREPEPAPAPAARDHDPAHGRGERRDDRRDARVENQSGWAKLGERAVDGRDDVDTILVTGSEGKYTRIKLAIEHSAIEIESVVVTFGDGSTFSPETRELIGRGDNTRTIDLPGAARTIRSVRFRYGNVPGGGRAQIELWAR